MLLDSYAWVEYFISSRKGGAVKEIIRKNHCFTSAVSIAELSEWAEKEGRERTKLLDAVRSLSEVLLPDESTFELAGVLKHEKRKKSKNFGTIDAVILATSKQYSLKVVTGDKHFSDENSIML